MESPNHEMQDRKSHESLQSSCRVISRTRPPTCNYQQDLNSALRRLRRVSCCVTCLRPESWTQRPETFVLPLSSGLYTNAGIAVSHDACRHVSTALRIAHGSAYHCTSSCVRLVSSRPGLVAAARQGEMCWLHCL